MASDILLLLILSLINRFEKSIIINYSIGFWDITLKFSIKIISNKQHIIFYYSYIYILDYSHNNLSILFRFPMSSSVLYEVLLT